MHRLLVLLCLLVLAAVPSSATAADPVATEGTGENIDHVRNLAYPELHEPEEANAGTDLEFATIPVPAPASTPAKPRPCAKLRKARKAPKGSRRRAAPRCASAAGRRSGASRHSPRR